jgi:glutamate synthase (ferredoxin)
MISISLVAVLVIWAMYDVLQRRHSLTRNFPIIGHFRYWIEMIGPAMRQYVVASNTEERPFDRDQRSWIYAAAKKENDYFAFGTDNELELDSNYLIIKHSTFPLSEALPGEPNYDATYQIPCAKVLGAARQRAKAFRPRSIINISGMSLGSLSSAAVEAINKGVSLANCHQNTGEGGLAAVHKNGGELIWQIGSGYFGCRNERGCFDKKLFLEKLDEYPIKAIEIKLSQGAKPGIGGVLPARKVTPEIAKTRGIAMGQACISPAGHSAFNDTDSLLDFVEDLAESSGLPVGIKSAVGDSRFWQELAKLMSTTNRGVDFITIDGGEGGTGAAPLAFSDHVALPFKMGMARAYREFALAEIADKIVFIGSGKLGFPQQALLAFALGCDLINIGREAMLSIGCIQTMKCHTNRCPTGVATQSQWLMRGLDPALKAVRLANYVTLLRKEILRLSRACGVPHPAMVSSSRLEIIDGHYGGKGVMDVFGYQDGWGVPAAEDLQKIAQLMLHPQSVGKSELSPCMEDTPPVKHEAHDTEASTNRSL